MYKGACFHTNTSKMISFSFCSFVRLTIIGFLQMAPFMPRVKIFVLFSNNKKAQKYIKTTIFWSSMDTELMDRNRTYQTGMLSTKSEKMLQTELTAA